MNNLEEPSLAAPLTVEEIEEIVEYKWNSKFVYWCIYFLLLLLLGLVGNMFFDQINHGASEVLGDDSHYLIPNRVIAFICMSWLFLVLAAVFAVIFTIYIFPKFHDKPDSDDLKSELSVEKRDSLIKWQDLDTTGEIKKYIISVNKMNRPFNEHDYSTISKFRDESYDCNHPILQITN